MVEQLLTMIRLDPNADLDCEDIDLREVSIDVASVVAPSVLEKNIDLGVDDGSPFRVKGNRAMLEILI